MPGISAKLEMVLSNDSTKFEPFLYGKKNGAGSQKIGHFGWGKFAEIEEMTEIEEISKNH